MAPSAFAAGGARRGAFGSESGEQWFATPPGPGLAVVAWAGACAGPRSLAGSATRHEPRPYGAPVTGERQLGVRMRPRRAVDRLLGPELRPGAVPGTSSTVRSVTHTARRRGIRPPCAPPRR